MLIEVWQLNGPKGGRLVVSKRIIKVLCIVKQHYQTKHWACFEEKVNPSWGLSFPFCRLLLESVKEHPPECQEDPVFWTESCIKKILSMLLILSVSGFNILSDQFAVHTAYIISFFFVIAFVCWTFMLFTTDLLDSFSYTSLTKMLPTQFDSLSRCCYRSPCYPAYSSWPSSTFFSPSHTFSYLPCITFAQNSLSLSHVVLDFV